MSLCVPKDVHLHYFGFWKIASLSLTVPRFGRALSTFLSGLVVEMVGVVVVVEVVEVVGVVVWVGVVEVVGIVVWVGVVEVVGVVEMVEG